MRDCCRLSLIQTIDTGGVCMKATVSVLGVSLFWIAFVLPASLILCVAGGCTSVSTEPGKSVNAADIPNAPGELTAGECADASTEPGKSVNPADMPKTPDDNIVETRFVPNPYTDDVIQLKQKMRDLNEQQSQCDRDKKGGEVDKNQ